MKNLLFIGLSVILFSSCGGKSQKNEVNSKINSEKLVGGWRNAEVDTATEKALEFVLKQMNSSAKLEKITNVKVQIVSGKNYDIDFLMNNGQSWNTVIYQDLQGNYEIIKVAARTN